MQISELTCPHLDCVVASCLGYKLNFSEAYGLEITDPKTGHLVENTAFTTSWNDAAPVLEAMRKKGMLMIAETVSFTVLDGGCSRFAYMGPTLEACMRCFVESCLGKDVGHDLLGLFEQEAARDALD